MQKLYIHQAVSISAQGFWEDFSLPVLRENLQRYRATDADYKSVIPAMALRRMAKITKMALWCGLTVSKNAGLAWDGIIVGTGLGNLADIEKFLNLISSPDSGLISPTAFTQSSHNTLSGQLALQLKNHGYNMTHVQRNFSVENALKDASLQCQFGLKDILLGAADEHIPLLDRLAKEAGYAEADIAEFGEGASFFQLSAEQPSAIFVRDVFVETAGKDPLESIGAFLEKNQVDIDSTLVLSTANTTNDFKMKQLAVAELAGKYMTSSGIAVHLACSYLAQQDYQHVLVWNNHSTNGLGLILLGHA